mmetsp:Transcript_15148/g.20905  ORF Transcript_15148/g.20905 Transcript_15148/m.20905 type:complete len:300 (-) Transcript_15148:183-1082(-)|eukprot:CAMPEP_0196585752 /NCGR_PEP_ID=MMETSP1081-20130531/51858_1 /TAXON_ID=36882 /ORGANISM="Pyramimonas amylifera, Strain CCMP720" /LENGTH=299 /DNA_ID=CAMNT_0041907403 /DNA_START=150 /DNA_END=1049 /DNA_ORIENTATION=-
MDPHDVLGVKKNAELHEIKEHFRNQARILHPDTQNTRDPAILARSVARFQELVAAYETLRSKDVVQKQPARSKTSEGPLMTARWAAMRRWKAKKLQRESGSPESGGSASANDLESKTRGQQMEEESADEILTRVRQMQQSSQNISNEGDEEVEKMAKNRNTKFEREKTVGVFDADACSNIFYRILKGNNKSPFSREAGNAKKTSLFADKPCERNFHISREFDASLKVCKLTYIQGKCPLSKLGFDFNSNHPTCSNRVQLHLKTHAFMRNDVGRDHYVNFVLRVRLATQIHKMTRSFLRF